MSLNSQSFYRFDDFELQPSRRQLVRAGQRVSIAPKTFDVLLCLVAQSGRVVLKEEILSTVWPDSFVEEGNLTQHIFWLRKALADRAQYIVTIPGRGYEFVGVTTLVPADPPPATVAPETLPPQVHVSHGVELTRVVVEEMTFPEPVERRPWLPIAVAGVAVAVVAAGATAWGLRHRSHLLAPVAVASAAPPVSAAAPSNVSTPVLVPSPTVPDAASAATGTDIPHTAVYSDHHQVVLADFDNSTGDTGFDRALKTLLGTDLGQSPFLVIASEADTSKALKLMNRPPDDALSTALAREVCERLNDQVVVSGLIARFGGKYLLTGTATDCESGHQLAQSKAVADNRETVLAAVDTLAGDLRSRLGEPLKSLHPAGQALEYQHTTSLEALKLYSEAHELARTGAYEKALPMLRRAVELDPNFGGAWLEITIEEDELREYPASSAAIAHAYEVRDQTDEPTRLAITALYVKKNTGDDYALLRIYKDWTERYPQQASAWLNLSNTQRALGRSKDAVVSGRRAVVLQPDFFPAYDALIKAQEQAGDFEDAIATGHEAERHKVDSIGIHYHLLEIADFRHDAAAIAEQLAWGKGGDAEAPMNWLQAYYLLSQGKVREAQTTFDHSMELYHQKGLDSSARLYQTSWPRYSAEMGLTELARARLDSGIIKGSNMDTVMARVKLGDPSAANPLLENYAKYPDETATQAIARPLLRAAQALALSKPEDAIAALSPTISFSVVNPCMGYYRGLAYLQAGKPEQALADFADTAKRVDGRNLYVPLAHLGMMRAYKAQGNMASARLQYDILRHTYWKDADPDFPLLKQARTELGLSN